LSESVNPHHHTEEDEENAEDWELDDGYADWGETIVGDELDVALVGEPDSVSSGDSTLSGKLKTVSMTSKRSFDEVDPTTKLVNYSRSRTYQHLPMNTSRSEKDTNAMTRFRTTSRKAFQYLPCISTMFSSPGIKG
jgi:hypothetical protein